jgi:two-component system, OmpR family, sensor histidine kinase TctE
MTAPAGGPAPAAPGAPATAMPAAANEQRSLFGEILDWMLAPLLLLWPMSLGLTWVVAQAIAAHPYDRELADVVRALARQATVQTSTVNRPTGSIRAELERAAATLKRDDDEDRSYYQVLGWRGELLSGEAGLAVPSDESPAPEAGVRFRDDFIGDEPVRVAYMWLPPAPAQAHSEALVQVAETLGKRQQLATEIIKGVILPQFIILPLAVVLVWFALARGIRPLAQLQQRIRKRESTDLSAIPEGDVPDEVAPLVRAINDLLQRLDKTIATQRHFLADAAHQLKTPLAGLRMQAELASRDIDLGRSNPDSMKHSLRQIAHSTQRAAHMVNQLLSMARAEDTGQAARHQTVDLAAVTRAVVRDFVPRAIERRIDLGYEGPDSSDSTRLRAEPVLLSEMDNALIYTPSGGTVTARVVPDPFGQVVVLQVEDTGPGIAPADREAVFRPFYRVMDTQVDGSGLGLAIVAEVAQRHGAEVTIRDARPRGVPGGASPGALFTVRFPLPAPPPATGPAPASPGQSPGPGPAQA